MILDIPPKGCLNVHASLLPKYRGPAPIPWALIRGEKVTGVTIMEIIEAMDAGPILLQRKTSIVAEDTAGTLADRLAVLGAEALIEALGALERGEVTKTPQNEAEVTYAPKLPPDIGRLEWSRSAGDLWNLVRGLAPQPGAYTFYRGRLVRVLGAQPLPGDHPTRAGTIVSVRKGMGIEVATGSRSRSGPRPRPPPAPGGPAPWPPQAAQRSHPPASCRVRRTGPRPRQRRRQGQRGSDAGVTVTGCAAHRSRRSPPPPPRRP